MKKPGRKPRAHLPRMMAGAARSLDQAIQAGTVTVHDRFWLERAVACAEHASNDLREALENLGGSAQQPALDRLHSSLELRAADTASWLEIARAVLERLPR